MSGLTVPDNQSRTHTLRQMVLLEYVYIRIGTAHIDDLALERPENMLRLGYTKGQAIDLNAATNTAELDLVRCYNGGSLHIDRGLGSDLGKSVDHRLAEVAASRFAANL